MTRVIVIGGGASGVLATSELLRAGAGEVTLVERTGRVGCGVAYGTPSVSHLLNVPARSMSADADRPDDFVRWAAARGLPAHGGWFAPRPVYGTYLAAVLDRAEARATTRLERLAGEVCAIHVGPSRVAGVTLADGRCLEADAVVIAVGAATPSRPAALAALASSPRYVADPWAPGALDAIGGAASVLLLGTGLTAVDVALALRDRGHAGPVLAVSRHGLLPRAHIGGDWLPIPFVPPSGARTARALVGAVRAFVAGAARAGMPWQAAVDGIRPHTERMWRSLPVAERQRFLRLAGRLWEVHRHRMAPTIAVAVDELVAREQLVVTAGRIERCRLRDGGVDVDVRHRESTSSARVARVVNCTGYDPDPGRTTNPVVRHLICVGLARPDELSMGLDATPDGALVGAGGRPSPVLYALGPLLRGSRFETTAVPEIRDQARRLADVLTRSEVGAVAV